MEPFKHTLWAPPLFLERNPFKIISKFLAENTQKKKNFPGAFGLPHRGIGEGRESLKKKPPTPPTGVRQLLKRGMAGCL